MCVEKMLYFDTSTQGYSVQQKIDLDTYCNAISFKNAGNIILLVDDEPLQPGESKAIGGNRGEILTGRHAIAFTTQGMAVVPPTQIPLAWVTQKYYIPTPANRDKDYSKL